MAYQWQTVEHAAVTLGTSTRTIARRIAQGKLETRLQDGRREVFINVDEPAVAAPQPAAAAAAPFSQTPYSPAAFAQPSFTAPPATPEPAPATEAGTSGTRTATVGQGYVTYSQPANQEVVAATRAPADDEAAVETALILAEDRARRAEMTLTVFHQSVTLATSEARRARINSRIAWCTVSVLAALVTVAVGWTASKVTGTQVQTDSLKDRFIEKAEATEKMARETEALVVERDRYRDELAAAKADRARTEGRLQELQNQAQLASAEVKATREALTELKVKAVREAAEKIAAAPIAPASPTTVPSMTKAD